MDTCIRMLCLLVIFAQISVVFTSVSQHKRQETECADDVPSYCARRWYPRTWPHCDERRYRLEMYEKCRKTCKLCNIIDPDTTAPCQDGPCQNGAICVNRRDTYKCICPPAFTGNNCQIEHSCTALGYTPDYYLNLCYKMYIQNPKTYSEAQSTCHSDGGQLVTIKGYHVYDLFRRLLKNDTFVVGTQNSGYWTDGKEGDKGDIYFSDGVRQFATYPGIDPDRDSQTSPVCMSLFWDSRLEGQAKRSCETTRQNFICSMATTQS